MGDALLFLSRIDKRFGGIPALRSAWLDVRPGEIHGLVGENGAGKSTLINIATGLLRPDAGEIRLDRAPITISSPRHAAALGIAVVHQEADLFPQLSIAENMLLRRGLARFAGCVDWPATYREAERFIGAMGESFNVREPAATLPVARRMMAEIATAVSEKARILFLDEPTSALTLKEIENLFRQIRQLREAGVGVVYVSHRLDEVLQISDRITVLRDGETVDTRPAADLTMEQVVAAMIGRDLEHMFAKRTVALGDVRLSVRDAGDTRGAFQGVSLDVRAGEILGLYGFVGAGRSEFGQALFGLRPLRSGHIRLDGKPANLRSPRAAVQAGLAYLPEDRLVQGVFRNHPVRTNATIAALRRLSRLGWIPARPERDLTARIMAEMDIRAKSPEQPLATLSGGNQQKVVFGRWRSISPRVLILDEPTRGVDVAAKAEIHKLICDMAAKGTAILLISSELPEIMAMSDRVVTLSEGRLTGTFAPDTHDERAVAAAAVPRAVDDSTRPVQKPPNLFHRVLHMRELALLIFIGALSGAMAGAKPDEFATLDNFFGILASAAIPAIMAQGVMLVICSGGIDISIGSMMGLVCACAAMAAKAGAPPLACLGLAVALGCCLSMLNGGTALLARIHPIIVTLAGISIFRGVMLVATGGREVVNLPLAYRALADGRFLGIPKTCCYVILITALVHVLLRYSLWGRRVLALGNSESAARLIGLSKTRLTLFVFAVSGALVGLAAVLHAGYYGKVQSNTGEGMELQAIAAAVIGGTNILGGRGSAIGTLLGAFLVALLYNIQILANVSTYWLGLFMGALILVAVVLDVTVQRLKGIPS